MLSRQEEQSERREVLENDKRVREQGSTFLAHTHNGAGGRFAAISSPTVIGAEATPKYPQGPAWCADPGSQMLEPPLSPHDNPALEPSDPEQSFSLSQDALATLSPSSQVPPPLHEGLGFSQRAYRRA